VPISGIRLSDWLHREAQEWADITVTPPPISCSVLFTICNIDLQSRCLVLHHSDGPPGLR
jgi:hypothetical protein